MSGYVLVSVTCQREGDCKVCKTRAEGCHAKLGGLHEYNPAIAICNFHCCNPFRL